MRIRPATLADIHGIDRVHVDTWRAAYAGIIPAEHLAALSYEQRAERWRDNLCRQDDGRFTLVAEDGDQVVGFASAGPARTAWPQYDGELYALYVLPTHQRRSIGRDLVRATAGQLAANGCTALIVWVLRDNRRARAFYEALGGTILIGGAELSEVAYGWPTIGALLSERSAQ